MLARLGIAGAAGRSPCSRASRRLCSRYYRIDNRPGLLCQSEVGPAHLDRDRGREGREESAELLQPAGTLLWGPRHEGLESHQYSRVIWGAGHRASTIPCFRVHRWGGDRSGYLLDHGRVTEKGQRQIPALVPTVQYCHQNGITTGTWSQRPCSAALNWIEKLQTLASARSSPLAVSGTLTLTAPLTLPQNSPCAEKYKGPPWWMCGA